MANTKFKTGDILIYIGPMNYKQVELNCIRILGIEDLEEDVNNDFTHYLIDPMDITEDYKDGFFHKDWVEENFRLATQTEIILYGR